MIDEAHDASPASGYIDVVVMSPGSLQGQAHTQCDILEHLLRVPVHRTIVGRR